MINIYILLLENDKYYIGRTMNLDFRLDCHFANKGCYWTKKHIPIKVIKIYNKCDFFDEDKYTLKYMDKYGINNVRGGSFCQIKLEQMQIELINKMLRNKNNQCYRCGSKDHFIFNCSKYVCKFCKKVKDTYLYKIKHEKKCKLNPKFKNKDLI
tara:strand:+ start:4307 stop:4768 length:462 start_codon:yes stop_codon:yes gene_type:complete